MQIDPQEEARVAPDISSIRVAVLLFPFAPPSIFTTVKKLCAVVASVAATTILISGRVPEDFAWPYGVRVRDIGVRVHYLKERQPTWLSALLWIAKFQGASRTSHTSL